MNVNQRGRADVVAIKAIDSRASGASAESEWLKSKITDTFNYAPALYDGSPISSDINLLIRFYPPDGVDSATGVTRDLVTPTVTVLDLVSPIPGKAYELVYGGVPVVGEGFRQPKSP